MRKREKTGIKEEIVERKREVIRARKTEIKITRKQNLHMKNNVKMELLSKN